MLVDVSSFMAAVALGWDVRRMRITAFDAAAVTKISRVVHNPGARICTTREGQRMAATPALPPAAGARSTGSTTPHAAPRRHPSCRTLGQRQHQMNRFSMT